MTGLELTSSELAELRDQLCAAAPFADLVTTVLLADDIQVRSAWQLERAAHAELLAAARAAVAAARDGERDPLAYIRLLLAEHEQLPPDDAHPLQLLAAGIPS